MHYKKIGPFITHVFENTTLLHTSRELRKSLLLPRRTLTASIALLFMIGSFCFASASFVVLVSNRFLTPLGINIIYFLGSLFFTSAAYLQYLESINADITHIPHLYNNHPLWYWWRWRPRNLGYISSLSQFIGTLFFNISTFLAIFSSLSIEMKNLLVWVPDLLGSILFLVSAFFAYLEIANDTLLNTFKSASWWVVWSNILGSVFFQCSAFFSSFSAQNSITDTFTATLMTLLGAVCFFIGAFLLRYEKS
jgi:hypothetical protein